MKITKEYYDPDRRMLKKLLARQDDILLFGMLIIEDFYTLKLEDFIKGEKINNRLYYEYKII